MAGIQQWKQTAIAKSRQLATFKMAAPTAALGNMAIGVGAASAAGVLDSQVDPISNVAPSLGVALIGLGAGIAFRSPKALTAVSGVLSAHAYNASKSWGQTMDLPGGAAKK